MYPEAERMRFAGRLYNDMLEAVDREGISLSPYALRFLHMSSEAWFHDPPNLPRAASNAAEVPPEQLYGLARDSFDRAMEEHRDVFRAETERRGSLSFPTLVH